MNGDAWLCQEINGLDRLALVDALGHGPEAAATAAVALGALETARQPNPASAIEACHHALRGTRGAALAVADFDPTRRVVTFAGVGNVEAYLWTGLRFERPISYRGIVGSTLPRIRSFELPVADDWLLLLHSDGIRARFSLDSLDGFAPRDPQLLVDTLLAHWSRPTDDATAVVMCAAPNPP